ncbi:hypothetical protein [Paenibacillus illinoisensis]|uniref:Uncharacterized protein n=1 Tax=Paenibacillus illinoisensis TaxID=59845 RepID=A0A2W0C706_9BACL|nr:hypothetical protein [Paenibacillus illinoisensis]PYY28250.1 hypothetical protein PIL02S_03396 [Paenibacillus illinoisensis]
MDELYKKYLNQPEPLRLMCNCGWRGNKPKTIKFKKAESKVCCPDCGDNVYPTADLIFWRTANGYEEGITFQDILIGRHGKKRL